jgi:uncharacterized protein YqjF (DUF2071 family)
MPRPFLTARWEHLVFLTYPCPAGLLEPYVPLGTTLDPWQGETFVSLVGFLFRDTLVRGIPIPCHRTFEEVNLRFYVRRITPAGEHRRGVVFLRELVPRRAIAAVARRLYNEPYLALPMSNANDMEDPAAGGLVAYFWFHRGQPYGIRAFLEGRPTEPGSGTHAEFITEHYWGYTRQRDGDTLEYRVDHPRWPVWTTRDWILEGPLEELYGPAFGNVLRATPASALVATGSPVSVFPGTRLALAAVQVSQAAP